MNKYQILIEKLESLTGKKVILQEAKIDDYYQKYVVDDKLITPKEFETIKKLDEPPYIYVPYLIKQVARKIPLSLLTKFLTAFKKIKYALPNKDINAYVNLVDIKFVLNKEKLISLANLSKQYPGAEKVASVDGVDLYWIKTVDAAKKYGFGTKWCISATTSGNMFEYYNRHSLFYFIIDKKKPQTDPNYKIALQIKLDPIEERDKKTYTTKIIGYKSERTYWDAEDTPRRAYRLPKEFEEIIKQALKKEQIEINLKAKEDTQQKNREVSSKIKATTTKEEHLLEPVQYLIKGEKIPIAIENAKVIDVRHTEVKSLINLKSCEELLATGCNQLESLGELSVIKDLGDFRGCSNLKNFNKLKEVKEAYINTTTNPQFVAYLKTICNNIIEI